MFKACYLLIELDRKCESPVSEPSFGKASAWMPVNEAPGSNLVKFSVGFGGG